MSDENEIIKASAEGLAEGVTRAFLEKVFGVGIEASEWARDHVRYLRWKSQVKTLERAERFLSDRGVDPERVPLKVLVPLLEGAGLEEENDEDMISRWAALLANTASGELNVGLVSGYTAILREIGPVEAAFVDWLYDPPNDPLVPEIDLQGRMISLHTETIRARLGLQPRDFAVVAENVIRLGLADRAWRQSGGLSFSGAGSDVLSVNEAVARTAFGEAFVHACTAP